MGGGGPKNLKRGQKTFFKGGGDGGGKNLGLSVYPYPDKAGSQRTRNCSSPRSTGGQCAQGQLLIFRFVRNGESLIFLKPTATKLDPSDTTLLHTWARCKNCVCTVPKVSYDTVLPSCPDRTPRPSTVFLRTVFFLRFKTKNPIKKVGWTLCRGAIFF